MLTRFGKFVRKLRIDAGELLKDMADKLNVTPSYLSAVENGKRNVPVEWIEKIIVMYELNDFEKAELKRAYEESIRTKVVLKNMSKDDRNLFVALAREFSDLGDDDRDTLKKILNKKTK